MEQKKYKFEIDGKEKFEKLLLILNKGILDSLQQGLITTKDAEELLYRPATSQKLKKLEVSDLIIELINLGCEIEDVESLIPKTRTKFLDEINAKTSSLLFSLLKKDKNKSIATPTNLFEK